MSDTTIGAAKISNKAVQGLPNRYLELGSIAPLTSTSADNNGTATSIVSPAINSQCSPLLMISGNSGQFSNSASHSAIDALAISSTASYGTSSETPTSQATSSESISSQQMTPTLANSTSISVSSSLFRSVFNSVFSSGASKRKASETQNAVIVSTFITIPLELRLQIYSYLLDHNVSYPTTERVEGSLSFRYDIGLFTVNRQISRESLSYFYSENKFVYIESNWWEPFLKETCPRAFPMIFRRGTCDIKHHALKITMQHVLRCHDPFPGFTVMAGRHLKVWVRLLNGFNVVHKEVELPRDLREKSRTPIGTIHFQIYAETLHYNASKKATTSIENAIQGIRQVSLVPQNYYSTALSIIILDRFGKKCKTIYRMLPSLTLDECFTSAQIVKNGGDKLVAAGQYFEAKGEYAIAAQLLGVPLWDHGTDEERFHHFSNNYVELCIRTWISMASLSSILRQPKPDETTCSLVDVVYRWLDQGYGSPGIEDSETVDIIIWKADFQSDQVWSSARRTLLKALRSRPGHEKLTAELQKLKKKQLQRWREDVEKQSPGRVVGVQE